MRVRLLVAVTGVMLMLVAPAWGQHGRGGGGRWGTGDRGGRPTLPAEPSRVEGDYPLQIAEILAVLERGEGRQALAAYEKTASTAAQRGDGLLEARAQSATAFVALRLGMLQKTIRAGTRALEVYKTQTLANLDVHLMESAYVQVGMAYQVAGDHVQARRLFEEGLTFARAHAGRNREQMAVGVLAGRLASLALAQHEYGPARVYAEQAVEFFDDLAARTGRKAPENYRRSMHRHAAQSFTTLGRVETAGGRDDKAESALTRALDEARLAGSSEVELAILRARGDLALKRQEWTRALTVFQEAVTKATAFGRTSALVWFHQGVARAQARLGHQDEALASARRAVQSLEEVRSELQESALRSGFVEDKQAIYQEAVRLALGAGDPAEAFGFAERARSRAFLDLLGNQTTVSKGRTRALVGEEVRLRTRLAEARAAAHDADGEGPSPRARAELEAAERDYRAFLERVHRENLEQASLMSVEPVSLREVQALLPPDSTLVEYLVGTGDTVVWVIDRERVTAHRVPVGRAALIVEVRRLREAITGQSPVADVQDHALRLYRRIVGPVRAEIRRERVIIVPHDVLHYVPFGALRTPEGKWLVEDYPITTLPSASVLKYLVDKGAGASDRTLAVGNPAVVGVLNLRYAEREARVIGQTRPSATVLIREEATEAKAKALLPTMGTIHFATHGELDTKEPLSSALLLVPGQGEDGRLEVRELFGLDLNARLVVLSACQTGLGELSRGDELVGLQRGFLYAGTPAVITTLWQVDDEASFELMRAFYRELDQAGAVLALRRAQLATMQTFPHPYAWAGFGLTGVAR